MIGSFKQEKYILTLHFATSSVELMELGLCALEKRERGAEN